MEPGIHAVVQIAPLSAGNRERAAKELSGFMTEKEVQVLLSHEKQILSWLESPDHRARFATDPLGSLREMGVKLREETYRSLATERGAQLRVLDHAAIQQLRTLKIDLGKSSSQKD
jgi:hypothetical protein